MTALCKKHRRKAEFFTAPFAANVGRRHVVVRNLFRHLNIYDFTDFTLYNLLFDKVIEGRVTKNVTNHNEALIPFCRFAERVYFIIAYCERLFKQYVIARVKQRKCGLHMQIIHRSVYNRIGETRIFKKLPDAGKAVFVRHAVKLLPYRYCFGSRVYKPDYLHFIGIFQSILRVGSRSVPRAY